MTVYWEYAFLENALLDGLLLYAAARCARAETGKWRLLLGSAAGGGESLLFPLFRLPAACSYLVKFLGGVMIVLLAVKGDRRRTAVACGAFFFLTFGLGGLLTAVYSFFGLGVGEEYLVSEAPVALVLAAAVLFTAVAVRGTARFLRRKRIEDGLVSCTLVQGDRRVSWKGFSDSGNLLTYRGEPVCVASAAGVFALFGAHPKEAGRITVSTVNGEREAPVFVCESAEIGGERYQNVYFTVGQVRSKDYQFILHSAYSGGKL